MPAGTVHNANTPAPTQRAGTGNTTSAVKTVGPIAPAQKLQRSNAPKSSANPRDLTGKRKQQLEAQKAADQELAAQQMAMATAAVAVQHRDEVIDYSQGGTSSPGILPGEEPEIVEDVIEVTPEFVEIRVNSPIEDMVFGRQVVTMDIPGENGEVHTVETGGTLQFYNFEEGRRYKVPWALAEHLDRLGYLWH